MQEKMVRASKEDLGLLEKAAGQIIRYYEKDKQKRGDLFAVDYDKAAEVLMKIKNHLSGNDISETDHADLMEGRRPFYVSSIGIEFYVTRRKTLLRRNYKAHRSLLFVPRVLPNPDISLFLT